MRVTLNQNTLANLKPAKKYYDVWDEKIRGLHIRVSPHGSMTYRCLYRRGKIKTLGKVGTISLARARDQSQYLLGLAAIGDDPASRKKLYENMPFATYVEEHYLSWFLANRKYAKKDAARIQSQLLPIFGKKALKDMDTHLIEKWCESRLKQGIKPVTINRDVAMLRVALSKAVEWKFLQQHPFKEWKPLKVDKTPKVRYLTTEEEHRLRQALDDRENRLKQQRASANQWRAQRGYELLPDLSDHQFVDHVKPMVLLTINTGLRRGELLQLTWDAINLKQRLLSVYGENAKSGRTRHIPLNEEAAAILKHWHAQIDKTATLVFPNQIGNMYTDIRKPWYALLKMANINYFRWHDLRHHFASKLVMHGVDLNTVRELLGHADLTMTLRYAHLAPEHKAKAVAVLVDNKYLSNVAL